MAVPTITVLPGGRIAVFGSLSAIKIKIVASTTAYLASAGGLPFDLAAVLNSAGPASAPINPDDVIGIIPAVTTNLDLAANLSLGRATAADGTVAAGSTAFSSAGATFTAADTGLSISIPGAGPGGATLVTTVTYSSGTALTLGTAASTSVTTAVCQVGCPTYTSGHVAGSVTRVDANVRPELTLATCPAWVHLYATGAGSAAVFGEFANGSNSDTITCLLLIARGGTNVN
jgi:hypothetical protein